MIPKIIHYCWLSNDPIPAKLKKCMDSWKKQLPDYEFMLWNFDRFAKDRSVWVSQAFDSRKYAFAADYIRLYALYNYGGIYLDMDVDISQRLMTKRYSGEEAKKDVHEANVEYLKKCRTAALYAADRFGWNVVKCFDGDNPLPIDTIGDEIFGIVKANLRR